MDKFLKMIWESRYKPIGMSFDFYVNCVYDYTIINKVKWSSDNFDDLLSKIDLFITEKLSHCKNCV